MQNSYDAFVDQNRQILIGRAREKGVVLTLDMLRDLSGAQLPLDMMTDAFLDAIVEELFTIDDIKRVYAGFKAFYTANIPSLPLRHDITINLPGGMVEYRTMPVDGWIITNAENATSNLIRYLVTPTCLNALRDNIYNMNDVQRHAEVWGPKALHFLNPDLIQALEEQRITEDDIEEMSYDELGDAISENRYPQDSVYSCN